MGVLYVMLFFLQGSCHLIEFGESTWFSGNMFPGLWFADVVFLFSILIFE